MTFANLKKGDSCLVVYEGGRRTTATPARVKSVGPKWIFAGGQRFHADTGFGEFGFRLHTEATFDDAKRRAVALHALNVALAGTARGVTTAQLEKMVLIAMPRTAENVVTKIRLPDGRTFVKTAKGWDEIAK